MLIPVLLGVSILASGVIRLAPGDAVTAQLQSAPLRQDIETMQKQLGLDRSYPEQYLSWIGGVVRGDFGKSFLDERPVLARFGDALPISLELAVLAMLFSLLLGIPLGIVAAVQHNRFPDYLTRIFSIAGQSIPSFWLGTLVVLLPSIWFKWSPPLNFSPLLVNPGANLLQMLPAAFTLGVGLSAVIMRFTRSSLLDVLRSPYIQTARSKGLLPSVVVLRHALRNALIPVVTVLGSQFGFVLGSTVIIETIFSLPGIGRLTFEAINFRDYPQVQANVMIIAFFFVLINLLVDIIYTLLDPRINLDAKATT